MTDATVGVIDQQGGGTKKVDVSEIVVNAQNVERQRVAIGDGAAGSHLAVVSADGGLYVQRVGAPHFAPGQVSLNGTTPVEVAAARTGVPGTGRVSITIVNKSGGTVWIGSDNTVDASTGLPVENKDAVTVETTSAIWAVLADVGTPALAFYEVY